MAASDRARTAHMLKVLSTAALVKRQLPEHARAWGLTPADEDDDRESTDHKSHRAGRLWLTSEVAEVWLTSGGGQLTAAWMKLSTSGELPNGDKDEDDNGEMLQGTTQGSSSSPEVAS